MNEVMFPVLEPDKAYLGASLFLPKSAVMEAPIRAALTFGIDQDAEPRILVRDHPHHLEVPRNFKPLPVLEKWGLEVVDLRPTEFEKTSLRPKDFFQFRPHQIPAWAAMCEAYGRQEDLTLRLDTGRGKTVMGIRYGCLLGGPMLVISWQEAHLKNWEKDLRKLFDLDSEIGWIKGKRLEWDSEVVFCTVQTLARRIKDGLLPPEFFVRFSLVIYDEAHHMAAGWFCTTAEVIQGARLSLTATLKRKDRLEGIVTSQIGRVAYDDPSEDAIIPDIYTVSTGTELADDDPDILDVTGQIHIGMLRSKLGTLPKRNAIIVKRVKQRLSEGHTVYVASHSKDLAYELWRLLDVAGISAGIITGDEKDSDIRMEQLNNYDVVVVTTGVGKENYNREELSALILVTPMPADEYAPTEWLQLVGRVVRPLKGKLHPVVDIFLDDGVSRSKGMFFSILRWCFNQGWTVHREDNAWQTSKRRQRPWRVS